MLTHWGIVWIIASIAIHRYLKKSLNTPYANAFLYSSISSSLVICFRTLGGITINNDEIRMIFLLATCGFGAAVTVLFSLLVLALTKIDIDTEETLALILPAWAAFAIATHYAIGWDPIPHISSNVTPVVLAMPYLLPRFDEKFTRILQKTLASIAILTFAVLSNTSCPVGVASVVAVSFYFFSIRASLKQIAPRYLIGLGLLFLIPIAIGCFLYGWDYFLSDTNRFKAYRAFMSYWWNDSFWTFIFGYGPGSFQTLGQIFQERMNFMIGWKDGRLQGELWMHLHSDLLECLVEYGLAGFLFLYSALRRCFSFLGDKEKCVLLGVLASSLFDFPLNYPAVPVILALLLASSVRRERLVVRSS